MLWILLEELMAKEEFVIQNMIRKVLVKFSMIDACNMLKFQEVLVLRHTTEFP